MLHLINQMVGFGALRALKFTTNASLQCADLATGECQPCISASNLVVTFAVKIELAMNQPTLSVLLRLTDDR